MTTGTGLPGHSERKECLTARIAEGSSDDWLFGGYR